MASRARRFLTELMAERILYGGLVATRAEVYDDALEIVSTHDVSDKRARRAAEMFAFGPRTRAATLAAVRAEGL